MINGPREVNNCRLTFGIAPQVNLKAPRIPEPKPEEQRGQRRTKGLMPPFIS
jgi:hypothetical protein